MAPPAVLPAMLGLTPAVGVVLFVAKVAFVGALLYWVRPW
jgi:hypothetical protein